MPKGKKSEEMKRKVEKKRKRIIEGVSVLKRKKRERKREESGGKRAQIRRTYRSCYRWGYRGWSN
jgi:hypothetical protein